MKYSILYFCMYPWCFCCLFHKFFSWKCSVVFFSLSCSVQAIHQKAMFLMSQCQDYLQRAKMVLHGVSKVISPISSVCFPFLWAEREENPCGYTFITFLDDEAVSNIFLGFHFLKTQTMSSAQYKYRQGAKTLCLCCVFYRGVQQRRRRLCWSWLRRALIRWSSVAESCSRCASLLTSSKSKTGCSVCVCVYTDLSSHAYNFKIVGVKWVKHGNIRATSDLFL